eukprot:SAG11_NODE_4731_length_1788_cov_1.167555_2_plen_90_part_00
MLVLGAQPQKEGGDVAATTAVFALLSLLLEVAGGATSNAPQVGALHLLIAGPEIGAAAADCDRDSLPPLRGNAASMGPGIPVTVEYHQV